MAPSPTGHFHIGTARAGLFNFLFAKRNKGTFILRIEDTDLERLDEAFTKEIIEGFKWLGIEWDEGPEVGGKFGPYRQTERTDLYEKYIKQLLDEDKAYYCFCSEEELDEERRVALAMKRPPKYSGKCRDLSKEEVEKCRREGKRAIIRFKTPEKKIKFKDLIRGEVEFDTSLIGDIAIAKDERTPLYNFAVVIDDHTMEISHVIRGEDHISNTPKQILIFEALGFPIPEYAHLPLILGTDKSKLSKRHGSTSVFDYRDQGYLPEAMVNFMALLGWKPSDDESKKGEKGASREIFTMKELIKEFSIDRVHKNGAIFNLEKLDWLNQQFIKEKPIGELVELAVPFLMSAGLVKKEGKDLHTVATGEKLDKKFLEKAVALEQGRIKKLSEIGLSAGEAGESVDFLFLDELDYSGDLLLWKKMTKEQAKEKLELAHKTLANTKKFDANHLQKELLKAAGEKRGELLWPLRVALTGKQSSPGPFEVAEVLGKEKTLKRIKEGMSLL